MTTKSRSDLLQEAASKTSLAMVHLPTAMVYSDRAIVDPCWLSFALAAAERALARLTEARDALLAAEKCPEPSSF